jgi:hypothetical protein
MKKKVKKSKKVVLRLVTSKDTKDALKMSFGEYMDTNPEAADQMLSRLAPDLKVFQDMANRVNEQMKSLGVLDRLKDFQETYQNVLKGFKAQQLSTDFFVAPPIINRGPIQSHLSSEDIDAIAERSVEILSAKMEARSSTQPRAITLVLTAAGDLLRNDDRTKSYSMRDSGLRLRIVRALVGQKGFRPSKELQAAAQSKSYASLTEAIRSINKKAKQFLNLPEDPHRLIVSKPHSGYMINSLYPIITE